MTSIPTVCRDSYFNALGSIRLHGHGSDDWMSLNAGVWSDVAAYLEPTIGADVCGSGSLERLGFSPIFEGWEGIWFDGTFDDLRIKLFLRFY